MGPGFTPEVRSWTQCAAHPLYLEVLGVSAPHDQVGQPGAAVSQIPGQSPENTAQKPSPEAADEAL